MGFYPSAALAPVNNPTFTGITTTGSLFTGSIGAFGVIAANDGTNTSDSGAAPVIAAPGFAEGVASQLSDLTRDYMVYLTVGTAGTAFTVAIGPTSGAANTIVPAGAATSGQVVAVRLPAGWYLKWSATTATLAGQIAVGC